MHALGKNCAERSREAHLPTDGGDPRLKQPFSRIVANSRKPRQAKNNRVLVVPPRRDPPRRTTGRERRSGISGMLCADDRGDQCGVKRRAVILAPFIATSNRAAWFFRSALAIFDQGLPSFRSDSNCTSGPIFFFEPPHCRRVRVFDLEPVIGAARPIGRPKALRHDALAAERASMLEDGRAVLTIGLIERDTLVREAQQAGQPALAFLDGSGRMSFPSPRGDRRRRGWLGRCDLARG